MKNMYPRPQLERAEWLNLNGEWKFEFDDEKIGLKNKWYQNNNFSKNINVPFVYQTKLSGINDQSPHDEVWYKRNFKVPAGWNEEVLIHFGAVDYETKVFVNGQYVGMHIGGNDSFSFEISNYLNYKEEEIVLWVKDDTYEERITRGKQIWTESHHGIWYPRTTGIWQTVWLEPVSKDRINKLMFTSDIDLGTINIDLETTTKSKKKLVVKIYDGEEEVIHDEYNFNSFLNRDIKLWNYEIFKTNLHHSGKTWTPENPFLYDVNLELYVDDVKTDEIKSYFGMRKVHQENGIIYLNNRPYYLKLVLDQGYYPLSLLTSPNDEDLKNDIILSKSMGFNGCRMHQKVAEERFYYHADKLGYLIWGEIPSTASYDPSFNSQTINEWSNIIKRDYNHPSIITWVVLNESWGVPNINLDKMQQDYAMSLYHFTKSIDKTRLVISNDGWEQAKTDISAIHNYSHGAYDDLQAHKNFAESLKTKESILNHYPAGRNIYSNSFEFAGEPIMLTEFGGISFAIEEKNGWGYSSVNDKETFLKEYERVLMAINDSEVISGFCYTQFSDVEQEINGLVTYSRKQKVELELIKKINDKVGFGIPSKK